MTDQQKKRKRSDRRVSERRQKQIPVELDRREIVDRRSGLDRRQEKHDQE